MVLATLIHQPLMGHSNLRCVHLIEHHSIRVAPSLGTLVELEKRRLPGTHASDGDGPRALVVGNPSFAGWTPDDICQSELQQLAGASKEANAVEQLLEDGGYDVDLLKNKRAKKTHVTNAMQISDIIHLATHGTSEAIFLAGRSEAEATLSMAEVYALDLGRTKLAVLSACDTSKGELRSDGVVGITRAFMAAGAQTIVASLWKVDDKATLELMRRFYRALMSKEGAAGNAAVAMQEAMKSMLADSTYTPLEWAAFVVNGLADVGMSGTGGTGKRGKGECARGAWAARIGVSWPHLPYSYQVRNYPLSGYGYYPADTSSSSSS